MAKNRFGQFIPDGNGKDTYEYFVTEMLKKISSVTSKQKTLECISSTTTGTIPAGSLQGYVYNTGNANGTFNGMTIGSGEKFEWSGGPFGDIDFDATGTTLKILYSKL